MAYRLQDLKPDGSAKTADLVCKGVAREQGTPDIDWSDFGNVDDALSLDQAVAHAGEHP